MTTQPAPHTAPDNNAVSEAETGNFLTRHVAPLDIVVEAIYTVLIVMTFTMAVKVLDDTSTLGQFLDVTLLSRLFIATLGCAVAWGLIDGVMYVFTSMAERSEAGRIHRTIAGASTQAEGIRLATQDLEDSIAIPLDDETRASIEHLLLRNIAGKSPSPVRVQREDIVGAIYIFFIALVIALPVILPLLLVPNNAFWALRLSNLVAFVMLFVLGFKWARYTGGVGWTTGTLIAAIGVLMVMIAIPLGG